jgi:hypothetical protein
VNPEHSLVTQIVGSVAIPLRAFATMAVLFFILRISGILRVSPEEELAGLDVSEHGMHAYPPSLVVDSSPGPSGAMATMAVPAAPVPASAGGRN